MVKSHEKCILLIRISDYRSRNVLGPMISKNASIYEWNCEYIFILLSVNSICWKVYSILMMQSWNISQNGKRRNFFMDFGNKYLALVKK